MIYTAKKDVNSACKIVAEDMLLTTDMPTAAGSKMLDGYMSLLEAEVLTILKDKGYGVCGKADVGEFAIDLLGETSYNGANTADGKLLNSSSEILKANEADAVIALDVNGTTRRAAAQNGLVSVKPTYGTVSRYGTVPVACSGETVSVMAKDAKTCRKVLDDIAGHDDKDGTSLPESEIAKKADAKEIKRIAIINDMMADVSDDVKANIDSAVAKLDVEVVNIDSSVIASSRPAWNILMSAELCNNVSRYDGVKYGHRAEKFSGIDELYTNSRTEAFGDLLKTAIIFGSETLSTENYMKVYDKALRTRRVIVEEFAKIFAEFDAVMIPACSKAFYTEDDVKADKYVSYKENFYTAPASITGLPAVVAGGVQLIGKAFSENALLELASKI
ncbi:MAG: hypothetical protein IKL21_03730 [Clostridia bacterium]|nr:hypothetical protein [Clostridia bacterium]